MKRLTSKPITFAERLATAFVSAFAAVITLLCYFVISIFLASKAVSSQPASAFSAFFLSKHSIFAIGLASVVGFVIGSERMAQVFSFFWGTHPVWEEEWFQKVGTAFVIGLGVALFIYLFHGTLTSG